MATESVWSLSTTQTNTSWGYPQTQGLEEHKLTHVVLLT